MKPTFSGVFTNIKNRLQKNKEENVALMKARDTAILKQIKREGAEQWVKKYQTDLWYDIEKQRVDSYCKLTNQYTNFPDEHFKFTTFSTTKKTKEEEYASEPCLDIYGNPMKEKYYDSESASYHKRRGENYMHSLRKIPCGGTKWTKVYGEPKKVWYEGRQTPSYKDNPLLLKEEVELKELRESTKETLNALVDARCDVLRDELKNSINDIAVLKKLDPELTKPNNSKLFAESIAYNSENYENLIDLLYDAYDDVANLLVPYTGRSALVDSTVTVVKKHMEKINRDKLTLDVLDEDVNKQLKDNIDNSIRIRQIGIEFANYTEEEDIAELMETRQATEYADLIRQAAKEENYNKHFLV